MEPGDVKRQENAASKKRGKNIVLIAQSETGELTIIVDESAGLRTDKDCGDWMEQHNYVGTLYPWRRGSGPLTRAEQKTFTISRG